MGLPVEGQRSSTGIRGFHPIGVRSRLTTGGRQPTVAGARRSDVDSGQRLMPLAPGFKLGRHEVLAFVGAGGMGEVYRARDTELGRVVALKVLRPECASDDGARRRLMQEARTASALNHPHITTVHDVVEADGMQCIVMEFVAGRPLSALIRAGLDLDEALRIAIAIADGLARAHAAGVVHRDLKPANVVVSDEGVPKVLDFGIAKLVEEPAGAAAQDATQTEDTGIVARRSTSGFRGTPGYMAPEQITGGTVDARSDIFSFGALLYEMLTGKRAFAGGTVAETLGAVLALQPVALRQLAPEVPVELEQTAMRCLRKEPERRFQSMGDVKVVLQDIAEARATSPLPSHARPRGTRLLRVAAAFALVLGVAVGVVAWVASWSHDGGEPKTPARLEALTTMPGIEGSPTFSPDGRQFAYSFDPERLKEDGRPDFDLWVRLVGGPDARRLTSDDTDDLAPSWSPDGRWIAYLRGQVGETPAVYLISPLGGTARPVTAIRAARIETGWLRGAPASQITWAADSRAVIFARAEQGGDAGGLQLARIDGGGSRALTSTPLPVVHRDPALSPDGRRLAYSACAGVIYAPCDVYVLDLDADQTPQPPARRLTQHDLTVVGLAWTHDGESLVFGGARFNLTHLWRVPADGSAPPARIEIGRRGLSPAIAASGDRLAFVHNVSNNDIYAFEPGQPDRVVASSTLTDQGPSYGPEGRFAFDSGRSGEGNDIWIAEDVDGSASQLTRGPGGWQGSPAWSPDGSLIAFDSRGADGFAHVWVVQPDGLELRQVTDGTISEAMPSWSRDSRWLYYREDRPDGCDLWRLPIAGGAPVQITHGGGFRGVEAPDGQTLVFTVSDDESALFAQPVAGGPRRQVVGCAITRSLTVGPKGVYYMACPAQAPTSPIYRLDLETGTELLLGTAAIGGGFVPGMSVSPDGQRILFTKHIAEGSDLMLVEHFR
jgi:Tol biopolymer transport system component/predicted Ser/Thr protein kinase